MSKHHQLPEGHDCFRQIVDNSASAIVIIDGNERIRYWNLAATDMFGFEEPELMGESFHDVLTPQHLREAERASCQTSEDGHTATLETTKLRKGGQEFWVEQSVCALDGLPGWRFISIRNAEAQKRREQELQHQARTDPLTGLANRREFQMQLELHLNRRLTLAIVDIDRFKGLNDTLGHPQGDEAIRFVASQLTAMFTDSIVVGRLGGDEFGVVLETQDAESTLDRFEQFRLRIAEGRQPIRQPLTASIGIALAEQENQLARDLLTLADKQLYHAKTSGRNRTAITVVR